LGQSVGISSDGSIIAAGAPNAAYVFVERPFGWTNATQTANLTSVPASDYFGYSISISGDGGTVVVGTQTYGDAPSSAYVFVSSRSIGRRFCEKGACWTESEELTAPPAGAKSEESFGDSVAISGDSSTIVVGAPATYSSGPGSAYVFGPGELLRLFPPFPPFPLLP